jgi:hypothetical protein
MGHLAHRKSKPASSAALPAFVATQLDSIWRKVVVVKVDPRLTLLVPIGSQTVNPSSLRHEGKRLVLLAM